MSANGSRRRWATLFSSSIGVDLRQALRSGEGFDPCEDGLRSVCWKAFLLYGPLSQGSWPKKLAESRSAYVSLRDHFLRYIEHPAELHSSGDPLADDDENSPWSTLRQDEMSREEIFKDVTRCMQDNFFFREPATQKKLLDILFIYAKLNPDIGYRQGMHELLAPILWVVHQDAVDLISVPAVDRKAEGTDFMIEVLNERFVEHDAFNLFCAVMQTAKAFYELGENRDSSPIVARSMRIHDEILSAVDPELAVHLTVVGILPQIYSIRWIRLLFGREFEFKDVLKVWDVLFAEHLRSDIVDFTCVAMLLRNRWNLIEADYTTGITALTHYSLPDPTEDPRSLVRDAVFLDRNRDSEAGALLIQRYSGRRPKGSEALPNRSTPAATRAAIAPRHRPSPSASPGRFSSQQRQLEGLFREVTGNLQKRTEGWDVSKAVRSAVGEVRRNVNNYQSAHSRQPSSDGPQLVVPERKRLEQKAQEDATRDLQQKLQRLQERNTVLAKMLDDALQSLRAIKLANPTAAGDAQDNMNICLAKIQFVSVYLSDSDIPIPNEETAQAPQPPRENPDSSEKQSAAPIQTKPDTKDEKHSETGIQTQEAEQRGRETHVTIQRPSLMESSFSFMLGENRHRSSFVSSVSDLPENSRESESRSRPRKKVAEIIPHPERKGSDSDKEGVSLNKIQGEQGSRDEA
ncbi:hypothetical protein G647_00019 [Cladophialophora carrionii CBS 160.54]|uniref:Rab-GAP TBC domain-containing protein n=1 Tax=Cladophialophora carrionii CBS 160.54 TaxID=1279043 RepID=V9DL37_9EURO|nr:uncharacterized protein G647_00019 [Cladophialophora carrionii CBS 160.54]ETI27570.1 hypothetical protein G647_00019 [Cladophialophora carrionii CBS 160.54]